MTSQAHAQVGVSGVPTRARRDVSHFIDGEFTMGTTGQSWNNRCPLDNTIIGTVPEGGKAEVDAAVSSSLDSLKDQIFRLELRRQAGTISEEEYAQERARAEKVLRDLVRG